MLQPFTPLLLGVVLIFWGWQTGWWWLGLFLGLLAELPLYLNGYWEFGLLERQRVGNLCGLLALFASIYLFFTQPHLGAVVILLMQWAPVLLFPVLALQIYGGRQGMELSVLFPSLRDGRPGGEIQLDLRPLYLLICLLGAAMIPPPGTFYYLGLGLIVVWLLWPLRSSGFAPWHWGSVLLLALCIGYGVWNGLAQLQIALEEHVVEWLAGRFNTDLDPYRTATAIGEIGRLKLSTQIVLRVWPDTPLSEPLLLRSSSFTRYIEGTWLADPSHFQPLTYDTQGWHLSDVAQSNRWIKIAMELPQGRGILPLPSGSNRLHGLKVAQLSGNATGVVKVMEGPELAYYRVDYGRRVTENPPNPIDLRIPPAERPTLEPIVRQLQLSGLVTSQSLAQLQNFFQQQFHYSLQLEAPPTKQSALAYFLTHSHSGHCEYFASAAVLLLRQAGIPARYVQGWSVQEYSDLEHAYIARARHAHAWALVWVNGAWEDFDPTPSSWGYLEAANHPWWEAIEDLWSWLQYRLAKQKQQRQTGQVWLVAGLLILLIWLAWRVARRGRHATKSQEMTVQLIQPSITIFTPIEHVLATSAGARYPSETLHNWLLRLQHQGEPRVIKLMPALGLYYRHRFDPQGLNPQDSYRLEKLLNNWLEQS